MFKKLKSKIKRITGEELDDDRSVGRYPRSVATDPGLGRSASVESLGSKHPNLMDYSKTLGLEAA